MNEKYLPIGSVVILKNANKRLMITGYCMKSEEDDKKVYDYCGCIFPEGIISTNQVALFNHEQIDKIHYIGLEDNEEKEFINKLKEFISNNK